MQSENSPNNKPLRKNKKPRILPLCVEDRIILESEIEDADGAEVLSAATVDDEGNWVDLRILARGTHEQAPAILRGLQPGDILLHNHPTGDLTPSDADFSVASLCGKSGIGFAIHDNECRKIFVVVEPFIKEERKLLDVCGLKKLLETGGPLQKYLFGYEKRPGQVALMEAVVESINSSSHAILEGETGIGKSMAYLIPAVYYAKENKCRVAVSTNTINLQHQLCEKDLPLLEKVVGFPFVFCLIKGRGNYLCLRRLQELEDSTGGDILLDHDEVDQFRRLQAWANKTAVGALSDLNWIPSESLWEKLNSDKDTCIGAKCNEYKNCFFYTARKKAAEADILVVNHHLLFTDLNLRAATSEYSQTAIIPSYKVAILDEAHNLEETATQHFGFKTTSFGFQRMLGRIYHKRGKREGGVLQNIAARISFGEKGFSPEQRDSLIEDIREQIIPLRQEISDIGREFFEAVVNFVMSKQVPYFGEHKLRIGEQQRSSPDFAAVLALAVKIRDEIQVFSRVLKKLHKKISAIVESDEELLKGFEMPLAELNSFGNRFAEVREALALLFDENVENRDQYVHFFSVVVRKNARWPALHSAPIDVAPVMREQVFQKIPSVIMVSATLTTKKTFAFMKSRFGLDDDQSEKPPIEGRYASPFDYSKQSCLFIPSDLPEPSHPEFMKKTIDPVFEIAKSSAGGTLILCTSYSHLQLLHTALAGRLEMEGIAALRQGEMERHHLLERFKEDGNAVLFATDSFWEGVDVPGNALRNLVIAKLPFAVPDDPILEARQEMLEKEGKNPFAEYQLPMAAIKLKQGFGRLIRGKSDRGTVWILDKRLLTKYYGCYFLETLPAATLCKGVFNSILSKAKLFHAEWGNSK